VTGGPVNAAALAQLRGTKVDTEELLRRRRDLLAVLEADITATEQRIADRERAQGEDRLHLQGLCEERGRQRGYLEARRVNGGKP
jgi:hypothetical protein